MKYSLETLFILAVLALVPPALLLNSCTYSSGLDKDANIAPSKEAFMSPGKDHYPETWSHFIGGNVSIEGITVDLEAIAEAGISGIQLFHGQDRKSTRLNSSHVRISYAV